MSVSCIMVGILHYVFSLHLLLKMEQNFDMNSTLKKRILLIIGKKLFTPLGVFYFFSTSLPHLSLIYIELVVLKNAFFLWSNWWPWKRPLSLVPLSGPEKDLYLCCHLVALKKTFIPAATKWPWKRPFSLLPLGGPQKDLSLYCHLGALKKTFFFGATGCHEKDLYLWCNWWSWKRPLSLVQLGGPEKDLSLWCHLEALKKTFLSGATWRPWKRPFSLVLLGCPEKGLSTTGSMLLSIKQHWHPLSSGRWVHHLLWIKRHWHPPMDRPLMLYWYYSVLVPIKGHWHQREINKVNILVKTQSTQHGE